MSARALSFLLLVLSCSRITAACSCGFPGRQPCRGLSTIDVVFVGTVIDIENPPSDDRGLGGPSLSRS
jgi:hypothetical protein